MLVRPGPSIEPHLLGIESILPIQVAASTRRTGARALLARLLVEALSDAGLLVGGRWRRAVPPAPRPQLATRWLLGELDAQVAVPLAWACEVIGLEPAAIARVVWQHTP